MVRPVPAAEVDAVWPKVKDWLEQACHRSGDQETIEGLYQMVRGGRGYILVELDGGAAILQRDADYCHIVSMGGKDLLKQVPALMSVWRHIADATGCVGLSLKGRKGWARVLRPYGFSYKNGYLET